MPVNSVGPNAAFMRCGPLCLHERDGTTPASEFVNMQATWTLFGCNFVALAWNSNGTGVHKIMLCHLVCLHQSDHRRVTLTCPESAANVGFSFIVKMIASTYEQQCIHW